MAKSIFTFEDEGAEYKGGGFQDMPEWDGVPELDGKEDEEDRKVMDKEDSEPENGDTSEDRTAKTNETEKADDADTGDTEEPEQSDPIEAFRAEQQQQFDFFRDQVARLNKELVETKQRLESATKPPPPAPPSDDDWAENPTEAAKRLVEAERERWRQEEQERAVERLRAQQQESVQRVVAKAPGIGKDPSLQAAINNEFYSDPDLQNDPDGPYKAAVRVAEREMAKLNKGKQTTPKQQQTQTQQESRSVEKRAAKAERERAAKVKKNVMHASGKGGQPKAKTLPPELQQMAREFGVSIDTLKAMEGIK